MALPNCQDGAACACQLAVAHRTASDKASQRAASTQPSPSVAPTRACCRPARLPSAIRLDHRGHQVAQRVAADLT